MYIYAVYMCYKEILIQKLSFLSFNCILLYAQIFRVVVI